MNFPRYFAVCLCAALFVGCAQSSITVVKAPDEQPRPREMPIGSQVELFKRDIADYLLEQYKTPKDVIKYSDANGNLARAVLNPDRVRRLIRGLKNEKDYRVKLNGMLEQYGPVSQGYMTAFTQHPGQYDAEYLDNFEASYELLIANVNANASLLQGEKVDAIKDERTKAMVQGVARVAQAIPLMMLKMLEQQIKENKFSEAFVPRATERLKYLQATQPPPLLSPPPSPPSPVTKSKVRVAPIPPGRKSECRITLVQGGREIKPVVADEVMTFKLSPSQFILRVSPDACNPSIALTRSQQELDYITQTPLIFGNGGYWVAGDAATADTLGAAAVGRDPWTTIDEEIKSATSKVSWAKQQYQELCDSLSYCPTPVKHYATAWPFLDPDTKKNRGFAQFKRFDNSGTMEQAAGRVLSAVVYTNWKTVIDGEGWNKSWFYILRPHAVVFDFRK